jgi:hypothetical protein
MKRGPRAEGELGGGVWMGETEGEITVHEISILVPKEINMESELSSVQGTQGMITAWIFATTIAGFLGFRTILHPYYLVQYTVYCGGDSMIQYDIFNALSKF